MQEQVLRRVGDYTIERCSRRDLEEVIEINKGALPEHYPAFFFEELLDRFPESFLVARKDRVVGYVMCRIEYGLSFVRKLSLTRKGHIVSIAVKEGHRRKGLGRALMEEAIKGLKARGCREAYLEVRVSNEPAISLYEKLGFRKESVIDGYYRDGEAAYLMVKDLLE